MKKLFAIISLLMLAGTPAQLLAAPETITVTHTYVMGDSESKNEARANCLAEAKRRIAEQAGAYVEVRSKTKNFRMDSDEVLSIAAALVRVTVEEENLAMEGQSLAITLTVRGEVDPEAVQQRLDELAERRLAAMEQETAQQPAAPAPQHVPEQQQVVGSETASAAAPSAPQEPVQAADPRKAKTRLADSLQKTTRLCAALTEKGMTRNEVQHLLGQPRAVKRNERYGYVGEKFGHLWVVYRDDEVACVRSRLEYRRTAGGETHCEGFATNFVTR